MKNILITGGAGFIGSHVVGRMMQEFPAANIFILDKMTYAADIRNLDGMLDWQRCHLIVGDLTDFDLCSRATRDMDCVLHVAAESHVDNSFGNSLQFTPARTRLEPILYSRPAESTAFPASSMFQRMRCMERSPKEHIPRPIC